jgi:hypothetical protein
MLVAQSFRIYSQLQRPDGIATVGSILGQLLLAAGQTEQAHQVLLTAATKIGNHTSPTTSPPSSTRATTA